MTNKTDSQLINFNQQAEPVAQPDPASYLPPQGYSRAKEILPLLPFSKTTLWDWSKDGRFPKPYRISSTITAWKNSDVIQWLESHCTTSTDVEGV